jgi:Flp pilus assembly pilin Flp
MKKRSKDDDARLGAQTRSFVLGATAAGLLVAAVSSVSLSGGASGVVDKVGGVWDKVRSVNVSTDGDQPPAPTVPVVAP